MLNKKLFVVCTKEGGYIKECVQKIIAHYPEDDILVVDSDSKDKSYMDGLRKYKNVVIADYKNQNYEYGAIRYGFLNNKNKYDVFFFIQDSMKIEGEIDLSILDEDSVLFFSSKHIFGLPSFFPSKETPSYDIIYMSKISFLSSRFNNSKWFIFFI